MSVDVPDAALAEWLRASVAAGLPLEDLLALSLSDGATRRADEAVRLARDGVGMARSRPGPDEVAAAMGRSRERPYRSGPEADGGGAGMAGSAEPPRLDRGMARRTGAGGEPREARPGAALPPNMLRFLPAKVALRALCGGLRGERFVDDAVARSSIGLALESKREEFAAIDASRGRSRDGFAASFGSDPRSRARLVNSMIGPAGRTGGCLEDLGWIRWSDEGCALTAAGLAFVRRRNPVLDAQAEHALSGPERDAILEALASRMEEEWRVMQAALRSVSDGGATNEDVERAISDALESGDELLSESTRRARRVATIGRMVELGLVDRTWSGRTVALAATDGAAKRMRAAEAARR